MYLITRSNSVTLCPELASKVPQRLLLSHHSPPESTKGYVPIKFVMDELLAELFVVKRRHQ